MKLIIPKSILISELYKEVLVLSKAKNITLQFKEYSDDGPESKVGLAFTNFDQTNNVIEIGIITSSLENEVVFIHEMLHAKMNLLGYPLIERYLNIPINTFLDKLLMSLQNIVHHTFVYNEMSLLGVNQKEIDDEFFIFLKKDLKTRRESVSKLATAINLLDAYTRDKTRTGDAVSDIADTHKKELELYFKMREAVGKINSPVEMKKAFCQLIKIIDDFIEKETRENGLLNIIIKVNPVFNDASLSKKASEVLYTLKLQGYPHVFVMDIINNQCCLFLSRNGGPLEKGYVDDLMQKTTLEQFLELL